MLWEIVRDFFVHFIFGGVDSYFEEYHCTIGLLSNDETTGLELVYNVGLNSGHSPVYLSLSDLLSTLATIITMVAILLFCVFIIKKIIGVMFRLFTFGA